MLAVLPALTQFVFAGESKYLEDLLAQIDAPRVEDVRIEYYTQVVQTPQLSRFLGRIANFKLAQFRRAQVIFCGDDACIELDRPQGECRRVHLSVTTLDGGPNFQVPYVIQDAMLSNVGHLSISRTQVEVGQQDDLNGTDWLPLLHLLPTVKTMHVNRAMALYIASAIGGIADEMVAKVLPALQLLCLEDGEDNDYDPYDYSHVNDYDSYFDDFEPVGSTERFLSLRRLSGCPVIIVNTEDKFVERLHARWMCQEKVPWQLPLWSSVI